MPDTDPDAAGRAAWMAVNLPPDELAAHPERLPEATITAILTADWASQACAYGHAAGIPLELLTDTLAYHGHGILFARYLVLTGKLSETP